MFSNYKLKTSAFIIAALFLHSNAYSQSAFKGLEHLFTEPKSYTLYHSPGPLKIDGDLNEDIWAKTPWTDYFTDIEGDLKPRPEYKTRLKMLWDDKFLYIGVQLEEPHIWANKKPEQDIIFKDNVFKIFIDPDNNMNDDFEIQINPQNNMLFLVMNKPYRDGGRPVSGWEPSDYKSAVKINGTMNNSGDKDSDWTAEIALPLAAFSFNPGDPKQNSQFRINFLRTGWDFTVQNGVYSKTLDAAGKALAPHYSCWTPQGIINMHYPERWGYTIFSANSPSVKPEPFTVAYSEKQKEYLWLAYYRQKEWMKKTKQYAGTLKELDVPENNILIGGRKNQLKQEATSRQFLISIREEGSNSLISIDQDGLISN